MSSSETDDAVFLTNFGDMWVHFTLWTMAGVGLSFFCAGVVACRVADNRSKYLWLPFITALVGMIIGFLDGSIPAALIAAIYSSINYSLGIDIAAGIGIGQAMIITYFNFGRADFIHK